MWEERYSAAQDYLFGTAPAQFLLENPGWLVPGQSALAVADGEGRNSVHMAKQGLNVTAFDLSPTAVKRAGELGAAAGTSLDCHVSDWQSWDWDGASYDLVVGIFIQFTTPADRTIIFDKMKSALKPGGVLLLHGYRPEQVALGTGGSPYPERMYTQEMLQDAFGDFTIERLASYERDVQEGRGHSGKSALIDLIARKV